MRLAAAVLAAFALTAPAIALAPGGWDLAAVKAHLQAELPSELWALLPEAAEPLATWSVPAPGGVVAVTLDLATGALRPADGPAVDHDGEDAGCTDYGGAFAVWEPSPPGIYPTCMGDIRHTGGITDITLICAGVTPGFGCAHVGVELDRRVYFLFLCGYPNGPLVGIEWPEQDLHVNCAFLGDERPDTWGRWQATLSANGPLLTHGLLGH